MPHGAFYLFPDFGIYRQALTGKGIYTSVEMCNTLLEETGVATLPGYEFGRDPAELTARIALVDFNGEEALGAASKNYSNKEIDDLFVQKYAPRITEAITRLCEWFSKMDM